MGASILHNGGLMAGNSYFSAIAGGIWDENVSDLLNPRFYWSYQMRTTRDTRDQYQFTSLWPRSSCAFGDNIQALTPLGMDCGSAIPPYEPFSMGESGTRRPYYIKGQCLDVNSLPLANATLTLWLTASNTPIFVGASDTNGNYSLPTHFYSSTHFITAYLPGAPDVCGTTANTLVPSP